MACNADHPSLRGNLSHPIEGQKSSAPLGESGDFGRSVRICQHFSKSSPNAQISVYFAYFKEPDFVYIPLCRESKIGVGKTPWSNLRSRDFSSSCIIRTVKRTIRRQTSNAASDVVELHVNNGVVTSLIILLVDAVVVVVGNHVIITHLIVGCTAKCLEKSAGNDLIASQHFSTETCTFTLCFISVISLPSPAETCSCRPRHIPHSHWRWP